MDYEQQIVEEALEGIQDWESDMGEHFGLMNEWANLYRMKNTLKEKRPQGVSKNMTAETPRAVNALATSITRMQTSQDPYFELRSEGAPEEELFDMEVRYQNELLETEFKRNLLKGNRGMCLFGTQVWEEPYMRFPSGFTGTGFLPLSLLQVAFRSGVYDLDYSDFIASINHFNPGYLRFITGGDVWDRAKIEEAIKSKEFEDTGVSRSNIEDRRTKAGYVEGKRTNHELILWHGRIQDTDNPLIQEMWAKYGKTEDPKTQDITVGILNRKHLVRLNPTPYGTWHHMYKIGHYIEFELEPIAYGVGALGYQLQKDMNRMMRLAQDVGIFSLYNMHFVGNGAGVQSNSLQVFPWNMIPIKGDVGQIKEIRPQIEGIINGLKLLEQTRDDFRGVTHATSTLQAVLTGATATESSLAQSEALRAISLCAEVNSDSVNRRHFQTMHLNYTDQNPYDSIYRRDVKFIPKVTTDKDFRPEHTKKLLEFLTVATSIRSNMPIDFNPMPIIKYLARATGINPRELKEPRPQVDRMLDAMRRINGNSQMKNEIGSEAASAGMGGSPQDPNGAVPNSPVASGLEVL